MQLNLLNLGLIPFEEALGFQKELHLRAREGNISQSLILCRHMPVITLGRSADKKNILASEEELNKMMIKVIRTERGGDATYHGPGQEIIYPILNLNNFKKDIRWFLRGLEEVIIRSLSVYGLQGKRFSGFTGVWINQRKIASIGIAIKNWTTFHGVSLNLLSSDLTNYKLIRPCGMDISMTSLEDELGRIIDFKEIEENLVNKFSGVFNN
ncbi:MAG TPA: lipoyl(octanoyl) transferase LipB [Candidatus Margulisiibacteriota bacterium]|nr:lipoyl(octanoyl) transferase LipB [Candidatus Margulisiibacteriota bacterium]